MTIDEAIAEERDNAKTQREIAEECFEEHIFDEKERIEHLRYANEFEQVAEWLEDYKRIKMLIPIEQALKNEYDKAIDDFVKFANTMPTVDVDGEIRPMWLEEMAEQLKAGGNIELSEYSKSKGNRTGK